MLTWFAEGLGYLRHHLDLVVHALPGFTVRQDEALLEQAGLLPVAGDPEVYRQALHPLAGVLPHLERIDQEISQLDWLRKALLSSQTGYAGVALKLGASLINPFGLVGAAREAYRVRTLQGRIAATETQGAADAAQRCVAEWNHLATQLLPVLGPAVERALLPARRTLTSHLLQAWEDAEDAERLLRALALRFARLENYRRFPPDGLDPTPRSSAIALLRRIRQEAPPLPFKPF